MLNALRPPVPAPPAPLRLWRHAGLASMAPDRPWGWLDDAALCTEGDRIAWVGPDRELPAAWAGRVEQEHDLAGALVTPGLIDCHTHLVYAGHRADEYERRLQGVGYEEIARSGGGILATVAATRAASEADLFVQTVRRADVLRAQGVTTLEVKSGYGLSAEHEARCLRVARRLGVERPLTVHCTGLAAHALPPEWAGRADGYIDAACHWLPTWVAEGLLDSVDAYCDTIAFTPAQTRRWFEAARSLGLPVRLHAEQFSNQGGAALAASFQAWSCDHLEHLDHAGVAALAAAGTVAVLLPAAFYCLRETRVPPVAAMRQAGVPIALATDHNPGSAPGLSLLLMLHMACTVFGLTPEEALRGVTVHAARALGLAGRAGVLQAGAMADFVVWDLTRPNELVYWFGLNPCKRVIQAGLERATMRA